MGAREAMIDLALRDSDTETPYLGPLLRWRPCPVCTHSDFTVIQRLNDVQFYQDGTPTVRLQEVQCQRCYALYRNPCYSDEGLRVLFAQAGASYGSEDGFARASEQVDWCHRQGLTGDLLDYGCGDGLFVGRWHGSHHRAGVERDDAQRAKAIAQAVTHPSLTPRAPVFVKDLPIPFAPDVVTLWHVLEHLPTPTNQRDAPLDVFRGHFLPFTADSDGAAHLTNRRLVVEVPVLERGFTDDICGFFSNQHTTHFSRTSLDNLLRIAGWEPYLWEERPYNGRRVVCRIASPYPGPEDRTAKATMGHQGDVALAQAYMRHHRAAVKKVDARFRAGVGDRPYHLWGAGMHTEMLYQETSLKDHLPIHLLDSDPTKTFTTWRERVILQPRAHCPKGWYAQLVGPQDMPVLGSTAGDFYPLVISSYGSQRAMVQQALDWGVPRSQIVTLYDDPVVY